LATLTNTAAVSGGGELNLLNDIASDLTNIVQVADLTITKSHTGNFTQGQTGATYTLNVSNVGSGPTVGLVTVVDTLPLGLNVTGYSGSGWSCVLATLICTRSDVLAAGASYPPITVTVNVSATAPATLTNTAAVSGGGELNLLNDIASDVTTILTGTVPDLTIVKSHVGNFTQGQTGASYSLTVSNAGSGATSGIVTVTDALPAALTATGMSGAGWSCVLATLTCTRSDVLAAAGSYPAIAVTVNVSATAPASVTNTATVSGGGETNLLNDVASDVTTILAGTVSDLTIVKSHVGNFTQGQTGASYGITVNNAGTGSTSGMVTVTDALPAALSASSMSGAGWSCVLATLTCTRSDVLAAGGSYPAIAVTVNVSATAPTSVTNTATVSGGGETNLLNDVASDVTTILGSLVPDLTIIKSHVGNFTQGQTGASYSITASNIGTGPTSGIVTVTDALPVALTASGMSGSGWSCVLATLICTRSDVLAASASYPPITVTVNVSATAPGSVTNTATISGGGETNLLNDVVSDVTTILTGAVSDLTIVKSHVGNFTQGQTGASYGITVSNAGTGLTSGMVTVTDVLPAALTASGMSGAGWSCVLATLTCTRSDVLAAGGSYPAIAVMVNVSATAPASVINTATVSGGGETNLLNDVASDVTTILTGAVPDLTVVKSHVGNFTQGQTGASYSITVSNAGTGTTSGIVTVADTLPAALTATGMSGAGWSCVLATLTCTRSDVLAAGGSYPAIAVIVNVSATAPASVTNTATVSGGGETNVGNDKASDLTSIQGPEDFTISAVATATSILPGQTEMFAVTITPTNGNFPSSVVLSVSGIPTLSSATFKPVSVTPGTDPANSSLYVVTDQGDPYVAFNRTFDLRALAFVFPTIGLIFTGIRLPRDKRRKAFLSVAIFLLAVGGCALAVSGCANAKNFARLGTPPGTYTVTVTGTSGSIVHSTTAQFVVRVAQ
jgi:uncharacterized repeat protein (TIGR01451 family)